MITKDDYMNHCNLCPRNCGVDRNGGKSGFCKTDAQIRLCRAALHFWEEPCISGKQGSGAIFFSGCNLRCIYCQNRSIALAKSGKVVSCERLTDIFFELEQQGANNINLVTPTHYIPQIAKSICAAKKRGFSLPFVYNSSAYESVQALELLDGLIDIYLPDFKYWTGETALKYSSAPDYPDVAKKAIDKMISYCPKCQYDENGLMKKGVIVRHMLLPRHVYEAKQIIRYLYETYRDGIVYSIMSQYTPVSQFENYSELNRKVTKKEYNSLVDYCLDLGIKNAYIQDGEAASESFIPEFDNTGI